MKKSQQTENPSFAAASMKIIFDSILIILAPEQP